MRWSVGLCLVVVLLRGRGGSDDPPDLEAAPSATETAASTVDEPRRRVL